MAWLQNGTPATNTGGKATTVTVPTGIVATDYCVFTLSGDQPAANMAPSIPSSSNGSAVIKTIIDTADVKNSYLSVFYVTGTVAGDTFTVTTNGSSHGWLSHFYFDTAMEVWGALGTRHAVNQNYVTAPAINVVQNSTVYCYAMSRFVGTNSLTSVVNSNGDTLNSLYSDYATATPWVSVNLWNFTEPTNNTGTTTITEANSSTNAAAFHFSEFLEPSAPVAWLT